MLSTQHYDDAIGALSDPKKKTVINLYYNDTKGGVDTVDRMVRKYSTKRATRRWPVSIFYTLVDIAALNGYTTFILNFPDWNKKKPNQRRLYLQELGLKLITPYIEERARNVAGLQKCVISAMEGILKRKIKQTSGAKDVHGEGLLLVDIMPYGTTINSDAYVAILKKLPARLSRVRRHREKQDVLLLHDNAQPYVSHKTTDHIRKFG
ncbi:hypothetical protein ANN_09396 [Periplaneta americana]|uniref:PiggyBac transposable element-derived protein domain-containing protein n=1 Tax=Periplaneta americana TaxID=6978 RepID=A0ABQ8TPS9_PERAM|nr:hypothetical protein ANN_09396 [Periplaneta americana]